MKINKEWHLANRMPKNASIDQRIAWHTEHAKNCSCRPGFPEKLREQMQQKGLSVKTR